MLLPCLIGGIVSDTSLCKQFHQLNSTLSALSGGRCFLIKARNVFTSQKQQSSRMSWMGCCLWVTETPSELSDGAFTKVLLKQAVLYRLSHVKFTIPKDHRTEQHHVLWRGVMNSIPCPWTALTSRRCRYRGVELASILTTGWYTVVLCSAFSLDNPCSKKPKMGEGGSWLSNESQVHLLGVTSIKC